MVYKVKLDMYVEIGLRFVIWILYICLDYKEPFHRYIPAEEIWKYQYPVTPAIVSTELLYAIIFLVPAIVFICEYTLTSKLEDATDGILGITLSFLLTAALTTFLKVSVGRPRPDFYFRCFPDGKGDDFDHCAGDRGSVMDGRKSFPSGHASFAFSCMTFVGLYLARKFHLFGGRKQSWELCVCVLPIVVASGIAISRTCDYRHHREDVAVGSLLGAVLSYLCFKLYFPDKSINYAPASH